MDPLWGTGRERATTATMEFGILGPLEVRNGGGLVRVPGAKERALLADLLVHAGRVVAADRLVEDLGGDQPPGTRPTPSRVGCRPCAGPWVRPGPGWW